MGNGREREPLKGEGRRIKKMAKRIRERITYAMVKFWEDFSLF